MQLFSTRFAVRLRLCFLPKHSTVGVFEWGVGVKGCYCMVKNVNRYDQRCVEQKVLCMSLSKVGLALQFCVCRSQDFLMQISHWWMLKHVNVAEHFQKSTFVEVEKEGDSVNQFLQLSSWTTALDCYTNSYMDSYEVSKGNYIRAFIFQVVANIFRPKV